MVRLHLPDTTGRDGATENNSFCQSYSDENKCIILHFWTGWGGRGGGGGDEEGGGGRKKLFEL